MTDSIPVGGEDTVDTTKVIHRIVDAIADVLGLRGVDVSVGHLARTASVASFMPSFFRMSKAAMFAPCRSKRPTEPHRFHRYQP
jgi:hypothetical protein